MNRIYRLIWSERLKSYIAVAEIVHAKGKSVLRGLARGVLVAALASSFWLSAGAGAAWAGSPAANALPTGGQVTAGTAYINTNGSQMNINQASQKAAINWQTFNIGKSAGVNFNQPNSSSIALNRVLSGDPSAIFGTMTANGQVFLLNPAGIIFGRSANVNVGGLVASTLSLSDSDFMNGNYNFNNAGGAGRIVNRGTLTAADGGYIALLAPQVINKGIVSARMGTVAMAAGDTVSLDFDGDGLINFTVNQGSVNALIDNKNLVQADGGQVIMSAKAADSLSSAVVNNEGIIQAQTIGNKNGVIMLLADMQNGTVKVSGTLDASAPNGGDGGFIETSAGTVNIADSARVTTLAPYGKTGAWLIDPDGFTIAASGGNISGATLSSQLGGGNVSIASTSGSGSDGNVNVNDAVSWSTHQLTLTATNDVDINTVMTATGTAGLDLEPGSGKVNVGFNTNGTFKGTVNLGAGTSLKINNAVYTIIQNSLAALQNMQNGLSGHYALGSDITTGGTFTPVGGVTPFSGIFDGLGHTITGLSISSPGTNDVGLFGATNGAIIRNVGLTNVNITGANNVGGLVGSNQNGSISNSYATGSVTGVQHCRRAGGLQLQRRQRHRQHQQQLRHRRVNG